jgi:capsular exopolysaccharide synthesis family protein
MALIAPVTQLRRASTIDTQPRTRSARLLWGRISRRRWFVVVALISTLVPAVALFLINDDIYRAEARMLLRNAMVDDLAGATPDDPATDVGPRRVDNEIAVLEGDIVLSQVSIRLGITSVPRVNGVAADGDVIIARVDAGTPKLAALLANSYIDAYIDVRTAQITRTASEAGLQLQQVIADLQAQIDEIDAGREATNPDQLADRAALVSEQAAVGEQVARLRIQEALGFTPAEVVSAATDTQRRVGPDLMNVIIAALAAGLALGLVSALAIDALDDTLRTIADFQRVPDIGPVIALIPVDPSARLAPLPLRRSHDPGAMAFRALRNRLSASDRPPKVVQVSGVVEGDGASTVAANLAIAYAEHGHRVVLVDADMRNPHLHRMFGVDGSFGLVEALASESIDMAALPLDERVTLLAAGTVPTEPTELLTGQRFADLIVELRHRFDHVILDTAPLAAVSDALLTSDLADTVIVVSRAGYGSRRKLQRAIADLREVSARISGIVVNQATDRRSIDRSRPDTP